MEFQSRQNCMTHNLILRQTCRQIYCQTCIKQLSITTKTIIITSHNSWSNSPHRNSSQKLSKTVVNCFCKKTYCQTCMKQLLLITTIIRGQIVHKNSSQNLSKNSCQLTWKKTIVRYSIQPTAATWLPTTRCHSIDNGENARICVLESDFYKLCIQVPNSSSSAVICVCMHVCVSISRND